MQNVYEPTPIVHTINLHIIRFRIHKCVYLYIVWDKWFYRNLGIEILNRDFFQVQSVLYLYICVCICEFWHFFSGFMLQHTYNCLLNVVHSVSIVIFFSNYFSYKTRAYSWGFLCVVINLNILYIHVCIFIYIY